VDEAPKRVLVVEDAEDIRNLLVEMLEEEGYVADFGSGRS
jgi:CheY-like chemotaxis protein